MVAFWPAEVVSGPEKRSRSSTMLARNRSKDVGDEWYTRMDDYYSKVFGPITKGNGRLDSNLLPQLPVISIIQQWVTRISYANKILIFGSISV